MSELGGVHTLGIMTIKPAVMKSLKSGGCREPLCRVPKTTHIRCVAGRKGSICHRPTRAILRNEPEAEEAYCPMVLSVDAEGPFPICSSQYARLPP